ncbi:MAG: cytochrome b N-terminal domain-containing protein, partial [Betaproteobacteria bacterium]|nr:cytochrome b N-terminal domain-containing protein [Betaproteobacteria bacterium]
MRLDQSLSAALARGFDGPVNPWRHLGALTHWTLVVTLASGIVTYALYDTSIDGAYQSGLRLQNDTTGMGPLLRGLHRYGADAFMLLLLVHAVREFLRGHHRGARWFSWVSGVPLVWLAWAAGLTGLWLLWDARALMSVTATAEWMQALPLVGDGIVRNFLLPGALNDRFFSLIMFLHIGLPLLLLGATWTHLQRIRLPVIWPAPAARYGFTALLALLALFVPAKSLGLADAHFVPALLSIDWWFQWPHALVEATSGGAVWWAAGLTTLALCALPWLDRPARTPPVAVVDPVNCNGCSRCAADCPTGAIRMVARTDARRHARQAEVDANLCVSCGICVGACPSATPFRRIEALVSGIELPHQPVDALRSALTRAQAANDPRDCVLVCHCTPAGMVIAADQRRVPIALECAGMLPPSFIDYALRQGFAGVVVAGCGECDCAYRLGDRWTVERLNGEREPHLRRIVPRERVTVLWGATPTTVTHAANAL